MTIGRVLTECRHTIDRLSTAISTDCRPSVDRLSTECRPSIDRLSTDYRPSVDRLSTECRPLYWPISRSTLPTVNKIQTFWLAEFISKFFCYSNSSKNITCQLGKLKTEFTSPIAKSTSPRPLDTTFFGRWTLFNGKLNNLYYSAKSQNFAAGTKGQ